MRLSASSIGTFDRCPQQYRYQRIDQLPGEGLSATLYGTVVHHAVHAFERAALGGVDVDEALERALATFDFYWHPQNIAELCGQRVHEWIGNDSYSTLRSRGLAAIRQYVVMWRGDRALVLSLEHPFEVPVTGTEHTVSGYVDRVCVRRKRIDGATVAVLDLDDWKTGIKPRFLRYHLGLTVYAYASTQRAFWEPFTEVGEDPDELFARYRDAPRHSVWYDLRSFVRSDAGYRGPLDYRRLAAACNEIARSVEAGIFPLRISGETCGYCPHKSYCPDGTGVPDDPHGAHPLQELTR